MTEIESEMLGGKNPIVEALRSGRELNKIWIAEGLNKKSIGEILSLAREAKVIVQTVPKQKLDGMLDVNHQGIIASVAAYEYAELEDLFDVATKRGEDPFFLILDELEDPHNLRVDLKNGRCIRRARSYYSKATFSRPHGSSGESIDGCD